MLKKLTIQPSSGVNYVQHSSLAFVQLILVTVEGEAFNISTVEASERTCLYAASEGRIYFVNEFDGIKKVNIKYKEA